MSSETTENNNDNNVIKMQIPIKKRRKRKGRKKRRLIASKNQHTLGKIPYQRAVCLIFGFTRDVQCILCPNNIIPNDISKMCFRFYYANPIIFLSANKPIHKFYRIYFFSPKLNYIFHSIYIKFNKSQTSYQMCKAIPENQHLLYLDVCIPAKWLSDLSISFHYYLGKDVMNLVTNSPDKLSTGKKHEVRAIFFTNFDTSGNNGYVPSPSDDDQCREDKRKAEKDILLHLLKDYNDRQERKYLRAIIPSLPDVATSDASQIYKDHIKIVTDEPTLQNIDKLLSLKLKRPSFYTKPKSLYHITRACLKNHSKLLKPDCKNIIDCLHDYYCKEVMDRLSSIKNNSYRVFNAECLYLFPVYNFFGYLKISGKGVNNALLFGEYDRLAQILINVNIDQETYDIEERLIEVLKVDLCNEKFQNRICPLEPIIPKFLHTIKKDGVRILQRIFTQLSKMKNCESIFEIIIGSMNKSDSLFRCFDLDFKMLKKNGHVYRILVQKWKELTRKLENGQQLLRLFDLLSKSRNKFSKRIEIKNDKFIDKNKDTKVEMSKQAKCELAAIKDTLSRYSILLESWMKQYDAINYMFDVYLILQNEINRLSDNIDDEKSCNQEIEITPQQLFLKQTIANELNKELNLLQPPSVYIKRVFKQKVMISNAMSKIICDDSTNAARLAKELSHYKILLNKCNEIIKLFQLYQKNMFNLIQMEDEWEEQEKDWMYWNLKDVICWIMGKLKWFNDKELPNHVNLNIIEKNMMSYKINGQCLKTMDEIDLLSYGFDKHYVVRILSCIQKMCCKKLDQTTSNSQKIINDDMKEIPSKYKCKLTNKMMREPVIAIDNETYGKKEIINYLREHKKSPTTNQSFEAILENENDYASMIFNDINLKKAIEDFQKKHFETNFLMQKTIQFD